MTKVNFIFNKGKDINNIWQTAQKNSSYNYDFSSKMPFELVDFCRKNSFDNSKKFIDEYFSVTYKSPLITTIVKSYNSAWKLIEKEYLLALEKITKKPLRIKKITAYLTIAPRCPYDFKENTFMTSLISSIPNALAVAAHEIMHLHFHKYYFENVEKEIGYEKTHELKESLTVLLNISIFRNLFLVEDKGYESHKDLRAFISNEWKKEKDFDKLIKNCIKYIKEEKNVK